jgi:CheY-like chemotaxis protein
MRRVLVIEDETSIRANLLRFLRLENCETFEAADGEAGLALALSIQPDLIFCDVMMPRMDGFQVLDALRTDLRAQNIPFFFLSASAEPERLEMALQKGAMGYLTKPFNLNQLGEILHRHLQPLTGTGEPA